MKNSQKRLSFPVIALAIHGDAIAINQILKHFEQYIIKLSQKTILDDFGNYTLHIEPEIKSILETKLIMAVLKFEIM